jgi:hypothetical protein
MISRNQKSWLSWHFAVSICSKIIRVLFINWKENIGGREKTSIHIRHGIDNFGTKHLSGSSDRFCLALCICKLACNLRHILPAHQIGLHTREVWLMKIRREVSSQDNEFKDFECGCGCVPKKFEIFYFY